MKKKFMLPLAHFMHSFNENAVRILCHENRYEKWDKTLKN